jgi:hypothetical protein
MCGCPFNDASSYRASEAPLGREVQREVLTDHPVSPESNKRDVLEVGSQDHRRTLSLSFQDGLIDNCWNLVLAFLRLPYCEAECYCGAY